MRKHFSQPSRSSGVSLTSLILLTGILAVLALTAPTARRASAYRPGFKLDAAAEREVGSSPFGRIMGEVRASLSDTMWVKTEVYMHRGVAYEAHKIDMLSDNHHPGDHEGDHDDHDAHDDHHDHGHFLKTLIPPPTEDYRGFIGKLHRTTQPWNEPNTPDEHMGGEELLPWYRLITLSNPHHWRGYMIGTWWLTQQKSEKGEALQEAEKFIDEGIRNNPEIFQLQLMRGRLQMKNEQWPEAVRSFQEAVDLALKIRPEGGQPDAQGIWDDSAEEDFAFALRYVVLLQWRKMEDVEAALGSVNRALTYLPDDGPLKNSRLNIQYDLEEMLPWRKFMKQNYPF